MTIEEKIYQYLQDLEPIAVELINESHKHIGHEGAKQGGHFKLKIISKKFEQKSRISRQRLVNSALSSLFGSEIHALNIQALTPQEMK